MPWRAFTSLNLGWSSFNSKNEGVRALKGRFLSSKSDQKSVQNQSKDELENGCLWDPGKVRMSQALLYLSAFVFIFVSLCY